MTYPPEFPEDYKDEVEAAITNVEQAFTYWEQDRNIDDCVREYARTIFIVYCNQLVGAVRNSKMSAEKARKEMGHQLRTLIADVYYEKKGSCSSEHIEQQCRIARQEMAVDWSSIQAGLRSAIYYQEQRQKPQQPTLPPADHQGKKPRRSLEPNSQLLKLDQTLNRNQAAEALGTTPRTLDRWVKDRKLTPVGSGGRKRFKTSELRRFLNARFRDN